MKEAIILAILSVVLYGSLALVSIGFYLKLFVKRKTRPGAPTFVNSCDISYQCFCFTVGCPWIEFKSSSMSTSDRRTRIEKIILRKKLFFLLLFLSSVLDLPLYIRCITKVLLYIQCCDVISVFNA